jgi:hypothetical protein
MRRSLLVLDVLLLVPVNASVGQFLVIDSLLAISHLAGASPVPVHSSHELEPCNFFIGEVSNDFEHPSAVSVEAENLKIFESGHAHSSLCKEEGSEEASDDPLSLLSVTPKQFIHYYFI